MIIGHFFADDGVESEALEAYGRVLRFGWDARDGPGEVIKADATRPPVDGGFDLTVWHPPCGRWASAPESYQQKRADHPNHIPKARELGEELGGHYIIENVPNAPLQNPVMLDGRMFGLPICMERAFETSYNVEQPPRQKVIEPVYWWDEYSRRKEYWLGIKGYSGDYRKDPLVKSAIPRAYVDWLVRPLLEDEMGGGGQARGSPR